MALFLKVSYLIFSIDIFLDTSLFNMNVNVYKIKIQLIFKDS